ncbi:MAG: serine/threonine-protein kinase [Byssovorax sp.]
MARLDKDSMIGARYRVVRLLGSGGMGAVYEAIDAQTGARVAVKVITAEAAANETLMSRFAREAEAAAAIDTPHIVRVLGSGLDHERGVPFLVLEYLDGEDLHVLIKRLGALSPDLALRIASQACLGLQRAHEMQIVHRDIKPANFFLAQTGDGQRIVKLLDFGVAKIKSEAPPGSGEAAGLTRTGSMLGSPLYMSPEQARGHRNLDHRSDIWSFGVVLYAALCGHTPRRDTDLLGELLILICTEAPEPLQDVAPWISPELAALVHRALRFDPGERYQSAAEMRAAINAQLPGDATIHEHLLRSLGDGERAAVAPSISESLHDAPAPRRSLGSSVAETKAIVTSGGRGATGAEGPTPLPYAPVDAPPPSGQLTSGGAFGTTVGRTNDGAPLSIAAGPATRSLSPVIAGMAGAALLLAGAAAAYVFARPPPVAPTTTLAPTTSAAAEKPRTVRVVVIPAEATVEVDGAAIAPKDGLVEIHGALGSVHAVHVKAGDDEATTNVVVTEDGALPPKIELHPAAAKAPTARPGAPVKGALPLPKSSAAPLPPSDFRSGR